MTGKLSYYEDIYQDMEAGPPSLRRKKLCIYVECLLKKCHDRLLWKFGEHMLTILRVL